MFKSVLIVMHLTPNASQVTELYTVTICRLDMWLILVYSSFRMVGMPVAIVSSHKHQITVTVEYFILMVLARNTSVCSNCYKKAQHLVAVAVAFSAVAG